MACTVAVGGLARLKCIRSPVSEEPNTDPSTDPPQPLHYARADVDVPQTPEEVEESSQQVRWFAYIAVAIAILSGLAALSFLGACAYLTVRWLM